MDATASPSLATDPSFHWMVLPRHGKRPLAIIGRSLLHAHNRCAGLPYWSEITIHETASGRFAAALRQIPVIHSADDPHNPLQTWCDAWLCATPDAVRAVFYQHDPMWALPPIAGADPALPDAPGIITDMPLFGDAASARRFQAAWAGLLAAVFGALPPARPPA